MDSEAQTLPSSVDDTPAIPSLDETDEEDEEEEEEEEGKEKPSLLTRSSARGSRRSTVRSVRVSGSSARGGRTFPEDTLEGSGPSHSIDELSWYPKRRIRLAAVSWFITSAIVCARLDNDIILASLYSLLSYYSRFAG